MSADSLQKVQRCKMNPKARTGTCNTCGAGCTVDMTARLPGLV